MTWQFSNYLELLLLKRWCHHPFAQHHRPPDFISQPRGSFKHSSQPKSSGQERRSPRDCCWLHTYLAHARSHSPDRGKHHKMQHYPQDRAMSVLTRYRVTHLWQTLRPSMDGRPQSFCLRLPVPCLRFAPHWRSWKVPEQTIQLTFSVDLVMTHWYMRLLLSSSLCSLIFNHSFIWVHVRYSSLTPSQHSLCLLHQTHHCKNNFTGVMQEVIMKTMPFARCKKISIIQLGS